MTAILPHELSALVLQNKRLLCDLLFCANAATLLEVARNPTHLGADIGLLSVLHTWGQNLQHHPHVHCVVPGGGLALDGTRWVAASSCFFLPVRVLSRVLRGKFTAEQAASASGQAPVRGSLQELAAPERFQHILRLLLPKAFLRLRKTRALRSTPINVVFENLLTTGLVKGLGNQYAFRIDQSLPLTLPGRDPVLSTSRINSTPAEKLYEDLFRANATASPLAAKATKLQPTAG